MYGDDPIEIFQSKFAYQNGNLTKSRSDLFLDWKVRQQQNEPYRQTKQQQFVTQYEESPPESNKEAEPEEMSHSRRHVENPTAAHTLSYTTSAEKKEKESNREIFRLKAVFPFDFFPDEIKIKENKIIILQREFFGSGEIRSFDPQEIAEVSLINTPFFAGMRFNVRSMTNNMFLIKYLKKNDALIGRSLIEGLRSMIEKKISTAELSIEEIKHKAMFFAGGKQYL